jgi:hypothetical protein
MKACAIEPALATRHEAFAGGICTDSECAAVSAMRLVVHEGPTPQPLQKKATKKSCPQSSQRACAGHLKPGLVKLGHCLVQQRALGAARVVALGLTGGGYEDCSNTHINLKKSSWPLVSISQTA